MTSQLMLFLIKLAHLFDRINENVGKAISALPLLMAFVQAIIIGLLFLFNFGLLWMQETILYMNGALFMLALGWTFKHDMHVRVDIFYRDLGERQKAIINFVGILILLLPACGILLWAGIPYMIKAWSILEGSRETGGIPALFLLKTIIPISAGLLAIQACAQAIFAARAIWSSK